MFSVVVANLPFFLPIFLIRGQRVPVTGGVQQEKHRTRRRMNRTKGSVGYPDNFKGKRRVFDRQRSMRADDPMRCSAEKVVLGPNIPARPSRATPCHSLSQSASPPSTFNHSVLGAFIPTRCHSIPDSLSTVAIQAATILMYIHVRYEDL